MTRMLIKLNYYYSDSVVQMMYRKYFLFKSLESRGLHMFTESKINKFGVRLWGKMLVMLNSKLDLNFELVFLLWEQWSLESNPNSYILRSVAREGSIVVRTIIPPSKNNFSFQICSCIFSKL